MMRRVARRWQSPPACCGILRPKQSTSTCSPGKLPRPSARAAFAPSSTPGRRHAPRTGWRSGRNCVSAHPRTRCCNAWTRLPETCSSWALRALVSSPASFRRCSRARAGRCCWSIASERRRRTAAPRREPIDERRATHSSSGVRADDGLHHLLPQCRGAAAARRSRAARRRDSAAPTPRCGGEPAGSCLVSSLIRWRIDRRLHQSGFRLHHRLDAGALRVPGAQAHGCGDRHAFCAANRSLRDRAHRGVLGQWLARPLPPSRRHSRCLYSSRCHPCDDAHRHALRGAHRPTRTARGAAGSGGCRGNIGSRPLVRVPQGDRARGDARSAHGLHARVRARAGRIRLGHLHFRQSAAEDRDHSAAHRHPPGGVRLPWSRGIGFRHAGDVVRDSSHHQPSAGLGPRPHGPEGAMTAAGAPAGSLEELATRPGRETALSALARRSLIGLSAAFLAALLIAPLAVVFAAAFHAGLWRYLQTFADRDTQAAIRLTLLTALVVVPVSTAFGLAAAWAIAKFEFRGKSLLITLIDLPIAVSPVISGMLFVLLFGMRGWFGAWLAAHGISIIFATPGIMIATLFVTFPYVARELIPLMQQLGNDEEEAAITLGAGAWMSFFRVTLPKIRWGLLYGVILCNART